MAKIHEIFPRFSSLNKQIVHICFNFVHIVYKTQNSIQKFSSYLKKNITEILSEKKVAGYSANRTKTIHTLFGQNAGLINIKAGSKYSYQRALKV